MVWKPSQSITPVRPEKGDKKNRKVWFEDEVKEREKDGIYMKRDKADGERNGEDNRKKEKIMCNKEVACEGPIPKHREQKQIEKLICRRDSEGAQPHKTLKRVRK